jgi:hypothetical protein
MPVRIVTMQQVPKNIVLVSLWGFLACTADPSQKDVSDTEGKVDTGTKADSGETMGGGPCGESGICDLQVEDEEVTDCLNASSSTVIDASFNDAGELDVTHTNARQGCCPEFSADAQLSLRNDSLDVNYTLANDSCDCVCNLNLAYTISGIPPDVGFTLYAGGATLSVERE